MERHREKFRHESTDGRASEAPKIHNVSVSPDEFGLVGFWNQLEWVDGITRAVQYNSSKI